MKTKDPEKLKRLVPLAVRFFFLCLILAGVVYFNRLGHSDSAPEWFQKAVVSRPHVFVLIYAAAHIFFAPSFLLCFAGGVFFGIPAGVLLCLAGQGIGSVTAFLSGRYLARSWVMARWATHEKFKRLNSALEKKGWQILILARLTPVFPFSLMNYAFGTTAISVFHYGVSAVLGSIPSVFVYVYAGSMSGSLSGLEGQGREKTPAEWALLIAGFLTAIIFAGYLRRLVRKNFQ